MSKKNLKIGAAAAIQIVVVVKHLLVKHLLINLELSFVLVDCGSHFTVDDRAVEQYN